MRTIDQLDLDTVVGGKKSTGGLRGIRSPDYYDADSLNYPFDFPKPKKRAKRA
jgi:hypothetical protein